MAKEREDPHAEERMSFDKAALRQAMNNKDSGNTQDSHLDDLWEKLQARKKENGEIE